MNNVGAFTDRQCVAFCSNFRKGNRNALKFNLTLTHEVFLFRGCFGHYLDCIHKASIFFLCS